MKKRALIILSMILAVVLLAGCSGTPVVYYGSCTCPAGSQSVPTEGDLKTGLAVVTSADKSGNAAQIEYDVTFVAVTVDDNGVIQDCMIDSLGPKVTFDETGVITSDLNTPILTKNELGEDYGMKAFAGSRYEWYEQAAALADYAVGKTVGELKNGAINESGKVPEGSDLAATATIYLGGYVNAIEAAVNNAQHLGAQSGDVLKLASISSLGSSRSATAESDGTAQLDCNVTAITVKDGVITSCYIDSVQAKVNYDTNGNITSDLSVPIQTKNQLGESYGMAAWGGAISEWNEQAAAFAAYVTGKTAEEVAGIAVSEGKATDADLAASVTISIVDFKDLIAKAMQ